MYTNQTNKLAVSFNEIVGYGYSFIQSIVLKSFARASQLGLPANSAVDMAESALLNAKHQEIKDLATAIITAQNKEIGLMKSWQTAWYK